MRSGHETGAMEHFWDPHPHWINQPDVPAIPIDTKCENDWNKVLLLQRFHRNAGTYSMSRVVNFLAIFTFSFDDLPRFMCVGMQLMSLYFGALDKPLFLQ